MKNEYKIESAVFIEDIDNGGFTGYLSGMPGAVCEGETIQEGLRNLADAIDIMIEFNKEA